jgi:hypothetical protein
MKDHESHPNMIAQYLWPPQNIDPIWSNTTIIIYIYIVYIYHELIRCVFHIAIYCYSGSPNCPEKSLTPAPLRPWLSSPNCAWWSRPGPRGKTHGKKHMKVVGRTEIYQTRKHNDLRHETDLFWVGVQWDAQWNAIFLVTPIASMSWVPSRNQTWRWNVTFECGIFQWENHLINEGFSVPCWHTPREKIAPTPYIWFRKLMVQDLQEKRDAALWPSCIWSPGMMEPNLDSEDEGHKGIALFLKHRDTSVSELDPFHLERVKHIMSKFC